MFFVGSLFWCPYFERVCFVLVLDCFWNLLEMRDWGRGERELFQILSGDRGKAFCFSFSRTPICHAFEVLGGIEGLLVNLATA